MALSSITGPVADATRFIIQLDAKEACTRDEGEILYMRLIEWIKDPTHPDYNEAATLIFFLSHRLLKNRLIEHRDHQIICNYAADTIQQTKMDAVLKKFLLARRYKVGEAVSGEVVSSPYTEICKQWIVFVKTPHSTRDQGLLFFEQLMQWLSICDEDDFSYTGSTITIFSMALDLEEKGLITPEEKQVLFQRAFQVIIKYPKHTIQDGDFIDFLQARGFKIKAAKCAGGGHFE